MIKNACFTILMRDNKMLLLLRAKKRDIGKWEFPGGKTDPGETVAEGMCRELTEEIGITDPVLKTITVRKQAPQPNGDVWYVTVYACTQWTGNPEIKEDVHSDLAWVSLADLRSGKYPCMENLKDIQSFVKGYLR